MTENYLQCYHYQIFMEKYFVYIIQMRNIHYISAEACFPPFHSNKLSTYPSSRPVLSFWNIFFQVFFLVHFICIFIIF